MVSAQPIGPLGLGALVPEGQGGTDKRDRHQGGQKCRDDKQGSASAENADAGADGPAWSVCAWQSRILVTAS
jgi:hypothetical protein